MVDEYNFPSKKNYLESKKWLEEAFTCYERAWVIFFSNLIFNRNDWHGGIEALQHSHELFLKSLWILFGFKWKRGHNPARDIDEVMVRYFTVFPDKKDYPMWSSYISWLKTHGKSLSKMHNYTIYGKPPKYPSELYNNEDWKQWMKRVTIQSEIWKGVFLFIGKQLDILSPEEEESLRKIGEGAKKLRENSSLMRLYEAVLGAQFKLENETCNDST